MYAVFFHVSIIALLEIIFYFYYIGPMETQVFSRSLSHLINDDTREKYINPFFQNNIIYKKQLQNNITNYYSSIINDEKKNREHENYKLLEYSLKYWSILFSISILIFILYISYKINYSKKENITKSDSVSGFSIELIN